MFLYIGFTTTFLVYTHHTISICCLNLVVANDIWWLSKSGTYRRYILRGNHHCLNHEWQHRPNFSLQYSWLWLVPFLDLQNQPIIRTELYTEKKTTTAINHSILSPDENENFYSNT